MRCPLCTGEIEVEHKFCGGCYERAAESIDRRPDSFTEPEQAVQVALTYLAPMYAGRKPLMVADEAELVSLAVTVSSELRQIRAQLADLREQISRSSLADRELVNLAGGDLVDRELVSRTSGDLADLVQKKE